MRPSPSGRAPAGTIALALALAGLLAGPTTGLLFATGASPGTPTAGPRPVVAGLGPPPLAPEHATAVHLHPGTAVVPAYGGTYDEPAPMGITDFGVTPGGTPYAYATPSWLGTVTLRDLTVTDGSSVATGLGFQLNVVLVLDGDGRNFTYWVQNVVEMDSSDEAIGFVNNIWNFSSPTATLKGSELAGNGAVASTGSGSSWYYYVDPNSGDGNGISLALPATVEDMVTTGTHDGTPYVDFLYQDGYGWVTYDNVSFVHGSAWHDDGFVVDGYAYAPIADYIYEDAEWDFTGAHSDYTDTRSNLSMELEYWNGHNYQEPPTAWDFGGNTGESMGNVTPSLVTVSDSGNLTAQETNGGGATLGALYGLSQVATLDATMATEPAGTVRIGSDPVSYMGGAANVTLAPGTYPVSLWVNGSQVGEASNVTLTAGEVLSIALPGAFALQEVDLEEHGLPAGTSWGVHLGGRTDSSTGRWLNFTLQNGTYALAIDPIAGFVSAGGYFAAVEVDGGPLVLDVDWSAYRYAVSFLANGLPTGVPWSVSVLPSNGSGEPVVASGSGDASVELDLANGSYAYNFTTVGWFDAVPANGSFAVAGGSSPLPVDFGTAPSLLVGTVYPVTASVTLDGAPASVDAGGAFRWVLAPGEHELVVNASGYASNTTYVTTTAGNVSTVTIALDASSGSGGGPGAGGVGTPISGGSGGAFPTPELVVGLAVVAGAALLGVLVALRARARRPPR
jgi:hypothetical protein